MPAEFPGAVKSWTPLIDAVDEIEAEDPNTAYLEITAIETWLLAGGFGLPVLVAASDASDAEKRAALQSGGFVCDGVNDHAEIQAALDTLRSVWLSRGHFSPGAKLLYKADGQAIRGMGRAATTITLASGSNCDMLGAASPMGYCRLDDLTLNGNLAGQASGCGVNLSLLDQFVGEDVLVLCAKQHGWYNAGGATGQLAALYRCWGNQCGGEGFHYESANSPKFVDCLAAQNVGNGFNIAGWDGAIIRSGGDENGDTDFVLSLSRSHIDVEVGTSVNYGIYLYSTDDSDLRVIHQRRYGGSIGQQAVFMLNCNRCRLGLVVDDDQSTVSHYGLFMNGCHDCTIDGVIYIPNGKAVALYDSGPGDANTRNWLRLRTSQAIEAWANSVDNGIETMEEG